MNNNKFIEPAFDGNENLLNFDSQTTTTTTAVTKGVIDADDLMNENNLQPTQGFDNEFGPETDVDAVDESMLMSSPHSVSQEEDDQMLGKEYQQFEQKEIDFTEAPVPTNPFGDDFIHHELQQPEHVTIEDDNSHSENDKSAAEQEYEAFLKHTAGQLSNEERNVFGLPKEVLGGVDEDAEKGEFIKLLWMSFLTGSIVIRKSYKCLPGLHNPKLTFVKELITHELAFSLFSGDFLFVFCVYL